MRTLALVAAIIALSAGNIRSSEETSSETAASDSSAPRLINSKHLPNLLKVHENVLSGGQPDGDEGFRELADRGIRTIISVDGAKPDVDAAKRYGLRYVHLPHGYNGVPGKRARELAKAVRELDGPIYVHCHHGKHRSPAAASIACVTAGLISSETASDVLQLAGTGKQYQGLFKSVRLASTVSPRKLDEMDVQFRETVDVPPLAESMVSLGKTFERLGEIADHGWHTPDHHPDLDPAHEALMLREYFTEMLRIPDTARRSDHYRQLLKDSEDNAMRLTKSLERWTTSESRTTAPKSLRQQFIRIRDNCRACHAAYRDIPLQDR